MIESLPLSLQTVYQELLEAHLQWAVEAVEGKPFLRDIKDKAYWYTRQRIGGDVITKYIGADTPQLRIRMKAAQERHEGQRKFEKRCGLWAAQLRAGGLPTVDMASGKLLNALSKSGVFRLGGTLVGTHAFRLYPAVLGAWTAPAAIAVTEDIDIASFERLSLAINDQVEPSMEDALGKLGLEPVPALEKGKISARWCMKGGGASLDFLTPSFSETEGLRHLEALNVTAQSLHFLNYLIADPIPAIAIYRSGLLVQIPRPERFAIHKLILSERRRGHQRGKAQKDVRQAKVLIEFLLEARPSELLEAYETALEIGPKWRKALENALGKDAQLNTWISSI